MHSNSINTHLVAYLKGSFITDMKWSGSTYIHIVVCESLLRLHGTSCFLWNSAAPPPKTALGLSNSYTCFRLLSQASKTKLTPVVIALVPSKTACPFGLKRFRLLRLFLCLSTWWWKPLWARAEALLTLTEWRGSTCWRVTPPWSHPRHTLTVQLM